MSQRWDAALYDQKHSFVFQRAQDLLELLAPQPGERILDLGCGTGHLTQQIAACGAQVVGLDHSPQMIAAARTQFPELEFLVADARHFSFAEPFDAIFSNAVLHWIHEADAVIDCIARALRPGGRFVAEFGGHGNVARFLAAFQSSIGEVTGAVVAHPWYYPSIAAYSGLLEARGLEVRFATLFDRMTPLDGPAGLRNWIEMFATRMLVGLEAVERETVIKRTEEKLRGVLCVDGEWRMDYRRLRVVAVKVAT